MSQGNLEIVRHVYDGWSRGDFTADDAFHPEVEFDLVDWPEPAKSRGVVEMWSLWRATLSAWDDFRAVPYDFIDADPHVVVLNKVQAIGKNSGAQVAADTASVWTMDTGKVVRLALYWDVDNAFEAAGVSNSAVSRRGDSNP